MAGVKKYAVIVAGGKGIRMGKPVPKQFLSLAGKPLLYHAISAFVSAFPDIQIILVLPEDKLDFIDTLSLAFTNQQNIKIVAGGESRFHSVQNGLKEVADNSVVFIHDGARPLASAMLITNCYKQALEKGSAIPAIAVAESMRLLEGDHTMPVNREQLRIIQTPQTFRSGIILPAFRQEYTPLFTDEATVAEAYGAHVYLIEGERSNIKVTTPEDMIIAEALLKAREQHA